MHYQGIPGSAGIAVGKVFLLKPNINKVLTNGISDQEVVSELKKLDDAIHKSKQEIAAIRDKALTDYGSDKAQIFEAHYLILEDEMFLERIKENITVRLLTAAAAVEDAMTFFAGMFETLEDEYMRERSHDIKDVGQRVINNLLGKDRQQLENLQSEAIIIAHDLMPSDTAMINKELVLGFASDIGGKTSHTAILARTLGIPAVLGLNDISQQVSDGQMIIIDGGTGKVIVNPSGEEIEYYQSLKREQQAAKKRLQELLVLPAQTIDGHRVELAVNIGSPQDVSSAVEVNAEGIGLYRTEFLYMDRESLPSEQEQFEAYKTVAQAMHDKPVIIRTLDIGGDKALPYLNLSQEANPFLGFRAIRICLENKEIFKAQLRAILRASVFGNVKIMYPMISGLEEIVKANQILSEAKQELRSRQYLFDENIEVGIMIEIPSAAVIADILAPHVDFFSIGTNDLCQYVLATDRLNQHIADYYQPLHPALLRLIKNVIDAAHKYQKRVGMCGELAGDPTATLLLLGMGLDEFSMSANSLPYIKKIIRSVSKKAAQEITNEVLQMSKTDEIINYLQEKVVELKI